MYLIFPPEYDKFAEAVATQAGIDYQYTLKSTDNKGLVDNVDPDSLIVTIYDLERAKSEDEVSKYRWSILRAMKYGAVFVHYDNIDEAHFHTPDENQPLEEQVEKILVAGRYAEARAKYFQNVSPKTLYVGTTYVNPLSVMVTNYDAKKDNYTVDYDPKMPNVLASMPEDLWMKSGFATARMSATLHHFLDELFDTAIVTFDKRVSKKVESYEYEQMTAPKAIDVEFGVTLKNTVKRKEVEEEG